jgi:DNA-binding NarL/FixJ family response regulator
MNVVMPNIDGDVIRIVIVDDHQVVREGLRAVLSRESGFEVCGDAGAIDEAMELVSLHSPHLTVVDMLLDNENGMDLIRKITGLNRNVRMLACSMYDDLLYAERALAAGAMGYVNKRAGISKIIEAIHAVMAGQVFLSDRMKQHILNRTLNSAAILPGQSSPVEALSNRELEIFRLIGHGMSAVQIGGLLDLRTKTVDAHSQRIRRHLQLETSHQLIREAAQWVLENG